LLRRFAFQPAPYPNARDFLAILREKAGPKHEALIVDLFETITLWDVKVTEARAKKRPDGRYDLSLKTTARKVRADGQGVETEVPLDEEFDIGAFTLEPGRPGFEGASVLAFGRVRVKSGEQTLTMVVDQAPSWAGVDPYNKRIDRNSSDNGVAVTMD
jgi:ABC-2 type transport system permease protein